MPFQDGPEDRIFMERASALARAEKSEAERDLADARAKEAEDALQRSRWTPQQCAEVNYEMADAENHALKAEIQKVITERDEAKSALVQVSNERDRALMVRDHAITERDETKHDLDLIVRERNALQSKLEDAIAQRDEARRDHDDAIEEEVDQQTRSIREALMDAMHDHALDLNAVRYLGTVESALQQEMLDAANADCACLRQLLRELRDVDWYPPAPLSFELAERIKRALGEE